MLAARGCSNRAIAGQPGLDEKAVRYHFARLRGDAKDGRSEKTVGAEAVAGVITQWMGSYENAAEDLQALHELLVSDDGYRGLQVRAARRPRPVPAA